MLRIGDIFLDKPFFQASLSGYSNYAMRSLARRFGAPLTFAGVVLDKVAAHPGVLDKPTFAAGDDEHPIGAQIMGHDSKVMAKAAKAFVGAGYDLIDLNFACPAPKVLRRQNGGFLLTQPGRIMEIYRSVRDSVDCPVLMKLRTGFDSSEESQANFWEICERACAEGVDGLIVHGRTVKQRYRGKADWGVLADLKRRFAGTILIGSGDLFEAEEIARRLSTREVDGVAIARGAIGNPWIFRHVSALLDGEDEPTEPSLSEQADIILNHFEMVCQLYDGIKAVRFFRKFVSAYCKLHPERKKAQRELIGAKTKAELISAIGYWYGEA